MKTDPKSWFEQLFGFSEFDSNGANQVFKYLQVVENRDTKYFYNRVNGKYYQIGDLSTPNVDELSRHVNSHFRIFEVPRLQVSTIVADTAELHRDPKKLWSGISSCWSVQLA